MSQSKDLTLIKNIANIITGVLSSLSTKLDRPIDELVDKDNLIALAKLFGDKKINNQGLLQAIEFLIYNPDRQTSDVVKELNLIQIDDDSVLDAFVELVVTKNEEQVKQYQSGKVQVIGFLVGQCMKESGGKGNPAKFKDLLTSRLAI
jgi:aspartyl-tRNA(Asn)/glutamyl-tRNA(Gln) amidotransferase subunit B